MNTARILELADWIEENPHHYYQGSWIMCPDHIVDSHIYDPNEFNRRFTLLREKHCGTSGCIAGVAIALFTQPKLGYGSYEELGLLTLGLPQRYSWLFYSSEWPVFYQDQYHDAKDEVTRAHIAAKLLRDLVNTFVILKPEDKDHPLNYAY